MQDFGRTPATALRMSMVTRAAGFAGLSFVPSRFSTPIRPTLLQHALYYPFPRPYKIIFYTPFLSFQREPEGIGQLPKIRSLDESRSFSRAIVARSRRVRCGPWAWPFPSIFQRSFLFIPRLIARDRTLVKLVTKRNS